MATPCSTCIDVTNMNCNPIKTSDVVYNGPNLPCTHINTKDNLTVILQKIDAKICTSAGSQNLQTTLEIGNTGSDINARFITAGNPSIYTDIWFDSFKAVDATQFISLTSNAILFSLNGTILRPASATANTVNLLLPSKPTGTYTIAVVEDIVPGIFDADIPVVLSGGKSLGKYLNGQTIPSLGKTAQEVITDIALEYLFPSFSFFSITSEPQTVEVGTTLSGVKAFLWSINQGSGVVPDIDIFDINTGIPLVTNIANTGSFPQMIATIQLNADGATQSWKGIGHNTSPVSNFDSGIFGVVSRYIRWWAPVSAYPVNPSDGAANRAYVDLLPNAAYKDPGVNNFLLQTGTVENKFIVLLPPGITIFSVIDLTNANTNITPNFILSVITINDIGGTPRSYNMYQYTNAIPYTTSANLSITTLN